MKVKTKLETLIELRDISFKKVVSLEAEANLIQGSIITMIRPDQEESRNKREVLLAAAKNEQKSHEKMVEELDKMIADEEKKQAPVLQK